MLCAIFSVPLIISSIFDEKEISLPARVSAFMLDFGLYNRCRVGGDFFLPSRLG